LIVVCCLRRSKAMKPERIWIVIADGHEAKVFERHGPQSELVPVADMTMTVDLPPNRTIQDDRPGRSFESSCPTRHAMESRTDPHRELKRDFARSVAEKLDLALRDQRFERLVIVAPPATLGDLRRGLSQQLEGKVAAELAKDLVHVPHHDLPTHLTPLWGVKTKQRRSS
jgi:protein required for attachment to host cells